MDGDSDDPFMTRKGPAGAVRREFEGAALSVVGSALALETPALRYVGLRASVKTTATAADTEVSIYFDSETGLEDIIEFFVYRNGRAAVSLKELEAWLTDGLADVERRRRQSIGRIKCR